MSDDPAAENDRRFAELMEGIRNGSQEAANQLVAEYGEYVERAVRRMLNKKMRRQFDSADFTQAVWTSLFSDPAFFERVDGPESLARYVLGAGRNKVTEEFRRLLQTRKYNVNRERSLDGSAEYDALQVAARQPTPSQVAATNEALARAMAKLPLHYQEIFRLRRSGMTQAEIAARTGLHIRTVQRVIHRFPEDGS
ncbi:MAG: sigma-70 family RNA polymerase sigma factor [Pirellulales bacterium]